MNKISLILAMAGILGGCGEDQPQEREHRTTIVVTDGRAGVDGLYGNAGQDGKDGKDGEDGQRGAAGSVGAAGVDGSDGVDGAAGIDGQDGAAGEDGLDGTDGTDGQDGSPGATGDTGSQGQAGIAGTQFILKGDFCGGSVFSIDGSHYILDSVFILLTSSWLRITNNCDIRYINGTVETQ